MASRKLHVLLDRLGDERGKKVVFVSHCLLNENVRYLGGAFRPGAVTEVVDGLQRQGAGICQMPCPEQRAWGGVLKRYTIPVYGSGTALPVRFRKPLTTVFIWYTKRFYARLGRRVARDIEDYVRSGFDVRGIVGIGGSPSCGVFTTLNLARSLDVAAACDPGTLRRAAFNDEAIARNVVAGRGLFIDAVIKQLRRRHLTAGFYEHDLIAEMRGERILPVDLGTAGVPCGAQPSRNRTARNLPGNVDVRDSKDRMGRS